MKKEKSVVQLVKELVSEEIFKILKKELNTYEEWESTYEAILNEIEEEERERNYWGEEENE